MVKKAGFVVCFLTANIPPVSVSSALLPNGMLLYQELSVDVSHLCWIQFFMVSM